MVWQSHSCQLLQQYARTSNLKLAVILSAEYGIFMPKTNSGLQQHIHQEQSILRQIRSNLEQCRGCYSGNSILLFFTKLLKNLEKQTYISLLLELISNWIDMCLWHQETRGNGYKCLLSYLEQQWFLHFPPFSLVGWILVMIYIQRQGKCSDSCIQISQPILVPAVATDDQPRPVVFVAVAKKFDIVTQNLQVPPAMQKKKKKM